MDMGRENNVLIHLVGDDIGVVLLGQRFDELQFLPGKHLSAGVGGVADDDGLGALAESILQNGPVEVIAGGHQGDIDGPGAAQNGVGAVVFIHGREGNHLVAGVADGKDGTQHGLRTAAGDGDLRFRVDGAAQDGGILLGDAAPQVGRAEGDGILVLLAAGGHLPHGLQQDLGRIKVGEALGQVDAAGGLVADAGHAADNGIGKGIHAFTELGHRIVLRSREVFFCPLL